jgi:chromosome segregation ATPase
MKTTVEQKAEHHERLVQLDEKRQEPQAQLADTIARSRTLRSELHAAQLRLSAAPAQEREAIKREIRTIESGVSDLQREADELESKIKRIDDEAAVHHAQIRRIELPEGVNELRRRRDAVWAALDAARIALAQYCICDRELKAKYGQEVVSPAGVIREELLNREHSLRGAGWTEIDAVSAPVGQLPVVAMLPPAAAKAATS